MSVEEYLACLSRQQLPQFVEQLQRFRHLI